MSIVKKINLLKIPAALFLFGLVLCSSCNKPARRGCMDQDAENYKPSAKIDCSCCSYNGKVVFGYSDDEAIYLRNQGVSSLIIYLDGVQVHKVTGDPSSNIIYSTTLYPYDDYDESGYNADRFFTVNLGDKRTSSYEMLVTDQNGHTLFVQTITVQANKVILVQL